MDSRDRERPEKDGVSLPQSLSIDRSFSSGGLRRRSSAVFPLSSTPSINSRLKSCTWSPRGNLRDTRVDDDHLRRGTGMAVASRIEASDEGLRTVFGFLGVRGGLLPVSGRADAVRGARLGGMTTGLVCIASDVSLSGKSRPETSGRVTKSAADLDEGWFCLPCFQEGFDGGTEVKRKALGTIIFTGCDHNTVCCRSW